MRHGVVETSFLRHGVVKIRGCIIRYARDIKYLLLQGCLDKKYWYFSASLLWGLGLSRRRDDRGDMERRSCWRITEEESDLLEEILWKRIIDGKRKQGRDFASEDFRQVLSPRCCFPCSCLAKLVGLFISQPRGNASRNLPWLLVNIRHRAYSGAGSFFS